MDTPTYLWMLERSRNRIGYWKGQGIRLDVGKVKELDWILERSRNQIGCWKVKESSECVYWLRLFKQGGGDKWQFLAAIIVYHTTMTIAKYDDRTWRRCIHGTVNKNGCQELATVPPA